MPAARAVRLQIWERLVAANRHQGLHYTYFLGQGRSSHGQCGFVQRNKHSQSSLRSYNKLLYSHYSFLLHVILHALLFINLCFLQLHCTIFQCRSSIYKCIVFLIAPLPGNAWGMRNWKLTCCGLIARHHARLDLYLALPGIGTEWSTLWDLVLHTCALRSWLYQFLRLKL